MERDLIEQKKWKESLAPLSVLENTPLWEHALVGIPATCRHAGIRRITPRKASQRARSVIEYCRGTLLRQKYKDLFQVLRLSSKKNRDSGDCTMISATRRWLRRNQTNFAIGVGVLGVGYVAGQYALSKITEARERMNSDRIAKDKYSNSFNAVNSPMLILASLRRRFQQNQEDCTFTVLALLPTATDNIIDALPVETITHDLQQKKAERLGRSGGTPSEMSSGPPSVTDEDGKSLASFQSESYVHASQMAASSSGSGDSSSSKPPKTKAQLWNDLKISCEQHDFLKFPSATC